MCFITMYAVVTVGVREWNGFAQEVKHVSQRQGDFNNILTLSDEAFLVLCVVNYQAKWYAKCNQHTLVDTVSRTASMMSLFISMTYQTKQPNLTTCQTASVFATSTFKYGHNYFAPVDCS